MSQSYTRTLVVATNLHCFRTYGCLSLVIYIDIAYFCN